MQSLSKQEGGVQLEDVALFPGLMYWLVQDTAPLKLIVEDRSFLSFLSVRVRFPLFVLVCFEI